jgi:hypothetical protein
MRHDINGDRSQNSSVSNLSTKYTHITTHYISSSIYFLYYTNLKHINMNYIMELI